MRTLHHLSKPILLTALVMTAMFISSDGITSELPPRVEHHQVVISGFEFVPKTLHVSPGDKVTWVNKDVVPHNVMASEDKKVISPDLASGEKFTFVVKEAFSYECGFHPSMKGKLMTP